MVQPNRLTPQTTREFNMTLSVQDMINIARRVGGQYAALHMYESGGTGRISTQKLRVGVSQAWADEQSLLWLDEEVDAAILAQETGQDISECIKGLQEQRASWDGSVTKAIRFNPYATRIQTVSGTNLFNLYEDKQGVIHPDRGLYFRAHCEASITHKAGVYSEAKSPKAIAKAWLRSHSPSGKFRRFRLTPANFDYIVFGGMTVKSTDIDNVVAAIL